MAIIVILCGAPHLYKKDMNNSGIEIMHNVHRGVIHLLNCDKKYKNLKGETNEKTV